MEESVTDRDDIYNMLCSNENHEEFFNKKIVKIRKEYSTIKTNSSICIIENNEKKINFEIKDNNEFLNKSHLLSNIKDLKDKLKTFENEKGSESENKYEKNRPNSSKIKKRIAVKIKNQEINEDEQQKINNNNNNNELFDKEKNDIQQKLSSEENLIFTKENNNNNNEKNKNEENLLSKKMMPILGKIKINKINK